MLKAIRVLRSAAIGNRRIFQCHLGLMVAPSFEIEGRMAAGLGCTTTASGSSRVKWNQIPALQIVNEDIVYDNHSSARLSCVRFSPPVLSRHWGVRRNWCWIWWGQDRSNV